MTTRKLPTVPGRPSHPRATVIDCKPGIEAPLFSTDGEENLACGGCGCVLVRGGFTAYMTLYLCCPECGTYNRADGGTYGASA